MEDSGSPIHSGFQMKEMELERMQSDLQALRKLYRFLQSSRVGERSGSSEILDEEAWLLMKNLLDDATEKILKTYSTIIPVARPSVSATPRSSKLEQERSFLELPPLKVVPDLTRNSFKDSNFQSSSSKKDECYSSRVKTPELVLDPPPRSISSLKPEPRKKICGACKQSNMNHQSTIKFSKKDGNPQHLQKYDQFGSFRQVNKDTRSLLDVTERRMPLVKTDEDLRLRKICRRHGFPITLSSVACSSRSLASVVDKSRNGNNHASEIEKKVEAASGFCKEVGNTIQKIESHISALQLCSELVHTAESSTKPHALRDMPSSASPRKQARNWGFLMSKLDEASESDFYRDLNPLLDENSRRFQKNENTNKFQQHDVTSDDEKDEDWIETWSRVGSRPYGNGFRVSKDQIAKRPPLPLKQRNSSHNQEKASRENMFKLRSATPSPSVESRTRVRHDHNQGTTHQILLDYSDGSNKIGRNRIAPRQLDSEDSAGWASQLPSTSSRDSEVYSVPDIETWSRVGSQRSQRPRRSSPYIHQPPLPLKTPYSNHNQGRNINTVKTSVRHDHKKGMPDQILLDNDSDSSHKVERYTIFPNEQETEDSSSSWTSQRSSTRSSDTYSSDSEADSVPGEKSLTDMTCESSSDNSNWSSIDNVDVRQCQARSLVPKKSPQRVGRLRRLKNKLGLIFYHHHHHHHHHHDTGRWKKLRNIFHRKSESEVLKNHQHQVRKSVLKHAAHNNQVGHFHALVQGLMKQKKHKKMMKLPDDAIGRSRKGRDKKAAKKLQWWRMIKQQRGTKAPFKGGRGRVKVELMSKRRQLKN